MLQLHQPAPSFLRSPGSVVDETNVLGRMRCARHLLCCKPQRVTRSPLCIHEEWEVYQPENWGLPNKKGIFNLRKMVCSTSKKRPPPHPEIPRCACRGWDTHSPGECRGQVWFLKWKSPFLIDKSMEIHHFLDTVLLWIVWWVKNLVHLPNVPFAKKMMKSTLSCNFTPRQVGFLSKNTSCEEYKAPAKKLGSHLLLEWKVT